MNQEALVSVLMRFFDESKKEFLDHYPGFSFEIFKKFALDYLDREQAIYFPSTIFTVLQESKLRELLNLLKSGKPLEYILQKKYFYKSCFFVNESVLIPRNESEILVEKCSEYLKEKQIQRIIEVGTGSGALLLSLALDFPDRLYLGLDISKEALEVTRYNLFLKQHLIPDTQIVLQENDRLRGLPKNSADLIFSNPPYIKKKHDWNKVHPQVRQYEPHLALFLADEDYLDWYREFFLQAFEVLTERGVFFMEGHEDHLDGLEKLALSVGFAHSKILQDYNNRNRFLVLNK